MNEETNLSLTESPDPQTILCRIVDVNSAIQTSFQKFVESENKTLDGLAETLRNELSKLELFIPTSSQQ